MGVRLFGCYLGRLANPGVMDFITHRLLHPAGAYDRHLIHRIVFGYGLSRRHDWFFGFVRFDRTTEEDRYPTTSEPSDA